MGFKDALSASVNKQLIPMDAIAVKCNILPSISRAWFCLFTFFSFISSIFSLICLHFPKPSSHPSHPFLIFLIFPVNFLFFTHSYFALTRCLITPVFFSLSSLSIFFIFFHFSCSGLGSGDRWSLGGIIQVKMTGTDRPTELGHAGRVQH